MIILVGSSWLANDLVPEVCPLVDVGSDGEIRVSFDHFDPSHPWSFLPIFLESREVLVE